MLEVDVSKSKKNRVEVKLQERDYRILRWLLEMKFADIEQINRAFFVKESVNLSGARTRIKKLERAGYLLSSFGFDGSSKKYYLVNKLGALALKNYFFDDLIVKLTPKISASIFAHDKLVTDSRLILESAGRARDWESEKVLKAQGYWSEMSFSRLYMPDAIYKNKKGDRVAFELEHSRKSNPRYEEKINKYLSFMSNPKGPFKYCLFVCTSSQVAENLLKLVKPHGVRFGVQLFDDLKGDQK